MTNRLDLLRRRVEAGKHGQATPAPRRKERTNAARDRFEELAKKSPEKLSAKDRYSRAVYMGFMGDDSDLGFVVDNTPMDGVGPESVRLEGWQQRFNAARQAALNPSGREPTTDDIVGIIESWKKRRAGS